MANTASPCQGRGPVYNKLSQPTGMRARLRKIMKNRRYLRARAGRSPLASAHHTRVERAAMQEALTANRATFFRPGTTMEPWIQAGLQSRLAFFHLSSGHRYDEFLYLRWPRPLPGKMVYEFSVFVRNYGIGGHSTISLHQLRMGASSRGGHPGLGGECEYLALDHSSRPKYK